MVLAYLFNHAGMPELTQKWVRRVMEAAKSDITPFGGYGGDEDQGEMGALNVLMALGLFSVNGGCAQQPMLELSAPIFERITIHLDPEVHNGKTFVIETTGNGPGERTIQSAELNGRTLEPLWFPHRELTGGGTLQITLTNK